MELSSNSEVSPNSLRRDRSGAARATKRTFRYSSQRDKQIRPLSFGPATTLSPNQLLDVDGKKRRFTLQHLHSDESEDDPEFKIGIPGYRAIFGKDSRPIRRSFWILLMFVFIGLAVVQVQDRISYYLKTPVQTALVVLRNETLVFPSVTVCNKNTFNDTAMEELRPFAARALGIDPKTVRVPHDLLSVMNLSTLWNTVGSNVSINAGTECWFGRGKRCIDAGSWTIVHTLKGPCFSYNVLLPVGETGLFHGLYMQIEPEKVIKRSAIDELVASLQSDDSWIYHIHPAHVNPALAIQEDYQHPNSIVDVEIRLFQSNSLNVWHQPCVDDANYTVENCQLECFSEKVVEDIGCLLPFMKLPPSSLLLDSFALCDTPESYRQADEKLIQLISNANGTLWDAADCYCMRQCYTIEYKTKVEKVLAHVKPNRLRLRVYFQDKTYERSTEDFVYSLTTLFCDIGSSVGLLLGASVLTVAEALEWGLFSLIRWIASTRGRVRKSRRLRPVNSIYVNRSPLNGNLYGN